MPGVEVLALELTGPERFRVYVDHPDGVDLALCERVTDVLRPLPDRVRVEVSSPGIERPLRKPAHSRAPSATVALRIEDRRSPARSAARSRRRRARRVQLETGTASRGDPVRRDRAGNLIDEGR